MSILAIVVVLAAVKGSYCVPSPTGLNITSKTATSITLRWDIVNNTFNYQVFYTKKDNGASDMVDSGSTASATISGLDAYTVYSIQVLANTTTGLSNKSEALEVRTDEAPPSVAPKITLATATSTSIYLEWDPIPKNKEHGVLLGYRILHIRKADAADYFNKIRNIDVNVAQRNATITGLKSYTIYLYGVAAFNSKGVDRALVNQKNVFVLQTKEGVPSAPVGLTAKFISANLSISWKLLTADQANGVIHSYHYIVYDANTTKANRTVSNTTSNVIITKLDACRKYVINVAARTGAGTGNYSVFNLGNSCGPPKITYHLPKVVTSLYSFVVLPCNFSGIPPPTVTWTLNDRKTPLPEGHGQKHLITGTAFVKHIIAYHNGSLVIDYVETRDHGLYTCTVKSKAGSASINTSLIVGGGAALLPFQITLLNITQDAELLNTKSSKHKQLSSKISNAVRGILINYTVDDLKVRDVKTTFLFSENKVIALFSISVTFQSNQKEHDITENIVDIMATNTQAGKLGEFSVIDLFITGIPPPPPTDLSVVRLQPNNVILQWKTPKNSKVYEINQYSMEYRKHQKTFKTAGRMVDNDGPTIQGLIKDLEAGEMYIVRIKSHREGSFNSKKHLGTTKEITTPNPMLKTVLLLIVLPMVLALIAAVLICVVIRPLVYRRHQIEEAQLENIGNEQRAAQENPYNLGPLLQEFPCRWNEIPRTDLIVGKELGAGAFGTVVRADLKKQDKKIPCAIKMLKPFATEREHRDLFNELSIMAQVGYHPNVIAMLGACSVNGPLWVVVKLAENGCLLEYLHKHRVPDYVDHAYMNVQGTSRDTQEIKPLDKLEKLKFAHGIARGMSHLEKVKCVHRDLAARNVLLDKHMGSMVSDFGLSRDIYESGLYEDFKGGKRPVRWMSPESIEDYTCTSKSDVWSFGVTMWEIETAGTVPYAGVDSGMDILNEIKKGYRLEKPSGSDDDIYDIILTCWRANPLDRPSFKDLTAKLEEILSSISEYLELQPEDEYQGMFTSVYDVVEINPTDLEEMENHDDVPNGSVSNDVTSPRGVLTLNTPDDDHDDTPL